MKKLIYLVSIIILLAFAYWLYNNGSNSGQTQDYSASQAGEINSYEECVAAGYPVMESYPEQCTAPDGRSFTRDISGEAGEAAGINEKRENNILISDSCDLAGGTWLSDFSECEYVDEAWCSSNKGLFNECGSACRNDAEAEICTLQCVPFCSLR